MAENDEERLVRIAAGPVMWLLTKLLKADPPNTHGGDNLGLGKPMVGRR